MRRLATACSASLLLLTAAPAAAAPTPLAAYDVSALPGWPEALAVCDITEFLSSRPDLAADVILTPDDTGGMRPLYGPRFTPPNLFFDRKVKMLFYRLERAGEVKRSEVSAARDRFNTPMLRTFRRIGLEEQRFLEQQSELCDGLADDVRARYP